MKVANVMLGGKRGGIEQAAVSYAEALRFMGHDVTTVIRRQAAILPALQSLNLPVREIDFPYGWNPLARRQVRRAVKDADIVILHGNRAGELVPDMQGKPPVVPVVHSRFFNLLPHFSAVIASSQAMKDRHGPSAKCPVYFLPNLIHAAAAAPRAGFRQPPVIGTMGRLSPEKGMDLFIDAIALLRQRGVAVEAVMGGAGGEAAALKAQSAALGGVVRFAGWIGDKAAFFRDIDIFCLTSRTETFPITVLEAMSCGCPAIATRCGGPAEMMQDGVNGLLADIDAASIADAIQKAVADPAATVAMGIEGKKQAVENYDLPVVAKKLDGILKEILAK